MTPPPSIGALAQKFIEDRHSPAQLAAQQVNPVHIQALVDAFFPGPTSLGAALAKLQLQESDVRPTFDFLAHAGILIPHHDPAVITRVRVDDASSVADAPSYTVSHDILHPDPV